MPTPRHAATQPLNHARPWDMNQEEVVLRMFATGGSIAQIAAAVGRTQTAVTSRIRQILRDPQWRVPLGPGHRREAANIYERRYGMPLTRSQLGQPSLEEREHQRRLARQSHPQPAEWPTADAVAADPADLRSSVPEIGRLDRMQIFNSALIDELRIAPSTPEFLADATIAPPPALETSMPGFFETTVRARVRNAVRRHTGRGNPRPAESAPEVQETPPHLEVRVDQDALAKAIKDSRPPERNGRVAAAQHSALNKVSHQLANLFAAAEEFDRASWLEACGVQTNEGS